MSKDVVIAGAIVAACLGLVTVAFVLPKHKSAKTDTTTDTATASTDTGLSPTAPGSTDPNTVPLEFGPPQPGGTLANNSFNNTLPGAPGSTPGGTSGFPPIGSGLSTPSSNPYQPGQASGFPQIQPQPQPPVAIEPPPAAPAASEAKTHVVASGETLGEISMKYYGTSKNWKKIAEANKVDPSELKVGQKITIPVIENAKPKDGAPTEAPALAAGEKTYKVRAGDSYYTIAKHELGNPNRWKELEKLNAIPAEELHVGQTIKLPSKDAGAATAPAPTPGASEPSTGSGRVHVVASGDTLAEISKKYFGTTTRWKDIVKANPGIDPEGLKVGQKLTIPEGATTAPATASGGGAAPAPASPAPAEAGDYVVKSGDTLETIAQSQLGSKKEWKKIVDANPGLDVKHIRIGQKLKIPGKAKPAEPAAPPTPAPTPGFGNPAGFGNPGGGLNNGNPSGGFGAPNGLGPTNPAYPAPTPAYPAPAPATPGNSFGAPPSPSYPGPGPAAPPVSPSSPTGGTFGAPPAAGAGNASPTTNGFPP
jgi:nucleoid-associated protein YgaU